jgi:Sel1 repeat
MLSSLPMKPPARCRSPVISVLIWGSLSLTLEALPAAARDLLAVGSELLHQGHAQQAFKLFSQAAAAGDASGAYGLGVLYLEGKGVIRDPRRSAQWFRRAADQGQPAAQFNLGNAYLRGEGVGQDMAQVGRWWRKAAQQGFAPAQHNLASLLLSDPHGGSGRREEGIAWLRAAAAQGFPKARQRLKALGEPLEAPAIDSDPTRELDRSEARLLTLDPLGYTIQLISVRTQPAQKHIPHWHLREAALPFRSQRNGVFWLTVVLGWYPSRKAAAAAIAQLAPEIRRSHPWIRPVGPIQELILAGRGTPGRRPGTAGR